jgi:hypothetical protein
MVNGALHMAADARDLTFQDGDPPFELAHRQWIEVLFGEEHDRIAGAREILFGIHVTKR